ncbi:fatty acid alpha-hydroxylase [Polyrhizophydium stewartii]|uniref:Ceramide very long chain fatty acid hydroxylase n=1 Tax=Polyrhizophydium stewartii TaxID=2732419 RepID=A0ABR4NL87_9FUNG|nr:fatty acid alpha-hydroxylase [Polyrhizophydium stewartii]
MALKVFSRDEVAAHHTAKSLWVTVNNKVYDISHFIFDHPGGEEILLQFGGRDITKVLQDPSEHVHSDAAYDMLEPFYIGELEAPTGGKGKSKGKAKASSDDSDTGVESSKVETFIDITKPMLRQVWVSNWNKEYYLKMVHIPRHAHNSAPIFGHPMLEIFSLTPWWVIPLFWLPIISYCAYDALQTVEPTRFLALFGVGLFNWTLIEYGLHRFLFHMEDLLPDHRIALTVHFLLHGIHHYLPMDRMRLVMPPALGFTLAYPIWSLYVYSFPNGIGQAMTSGSMLGFVLYDMVHYYIHHGRPYGSHLKEMKTYHLDHHYKNANLGFGITSKFWDIVFNTLL